MGCHFLLEEIFPTLRSNLVSCIVGRLSEPPGKFMRTKVFENELPSAPEKAMATHSSSLTWKIPWMENLVGCSPWSREESETTEQLPFHFSLSCTGEGNGNPLQCSCLENPRDGRAWWAAIYGVAQSWTRLKQISSSSHQHMCHESHSRVGVMPLFSFPSASCVTFNQVFF